MNKTEFTNIVWRYYLQLEDDFIATLRYVTLSSDNSSVYSVEYSKQLLSIGSEIDVINKKLFDLPEGSTMSDYKKCYDEKGFESITIRCLLNGEDYKPFIKNENGGFDFWKAYNKVKHERTSNYKDGNQLNVFDCLKMLYVLVVKLYDKVVVYGNLEPASKMFYMPDRPIINRLDERGDWKTVQDGDVLSISRINQ